MRMGFTPTKKEKKKTRGEKDLDNFYPLASFSNKRQKIRELVTRAELVERKLALGR